MALFRRNPAISNDDISESRIIDKPLNSLKATMPQAVRLAHEHASLKEDIEQSQDCACFYCFSHFQAKNVKTWVGINDEIALCPNCSIDAVLGDKSGYELGDSFLKQMHKYWF